MPSKPAAKRGEWIVEARLPARRVELAHSPVLRRRVPESVVSEDPAARESRLHELLTYLESVLDVKPVLLRAAGAVSITASPEELEQISKHPLVKRIEPNRRRQSRSSRTGVRAPLVAEPR